MMSAILHSPSKAPHAIRYFATGFVLFLGAAWFAAHPYMGLWHDARLYAVEALARLEPGVYDRDLFLAFGSQGKYTLFPSLFAALIDWLGLERAAFALALPGKLLWFVSLVLLARRLVAAPAWPLGLVFVLAYPAFYDSHKVFSYGESFATPRVYAEALSMLALAVWLQGRRVWAWALVGIAGVLHPLIAIPAAVLLGVLALIAERPAGRVWFVPVLGVLLGAAVLAAAPELREGLLARYDAAWLHATRERNPYIFLDQWDADAFGRMVWIAVVLGVAALRLDDKRGGMAGALLLTTMGLLTLSWLGMNVWENILLTQLQLWRVMWLAQLVALVLLGALLPVLWQSDYPAKLLAAGLAAAGLADGWSAGFMAVAAVLLAYGVRRAGARVDTASMLWKALPFLLVLPGTLAHLAAMPYWLLANEVFMEKPVWRTWLGDGVLMLALGAAIHALARNSGPRVAKALAGLGAIALSLAMATWAPSGSLANHPERDALYARLRKDIPAGAVVASALPSVPKTVWFDLGRASYASQVQTAGGLFNRDTALEGVRRLALLHKAGFPRSQLDWQERAAEPASRLSPTSAREACSDPGLDFVLLPGKWDGARQYAVRGHVAMSLYACTDFRKQRSTP